MGVAIRAESDGQRARLVPAGPFVLAHAAAAMRAVEQAERDLVASGDVDLDLSALERIDGSGAVLWWPGNSRPGRTRASSALSKSR